MRSTLFLLFLSLSAIITVSAQDKKAFKSQFLEAEYFFTIGEYKEARFIYSELLKEDPGNANLEFLIAACYLSTDEEKSKAIKYLESAVLSISPGYREGSYKEKNAPPEAMFALARAYHIHNQLDKAEECYGKYRDIMQMKDPAQIEFVYKQIESCKLAEKMLKNPIPFKRTPFFSEVNVYASNNAAVLAQSDSIMIFLREKAFYTAVMMTRLENGMWTTPNVINDQLGVDEKCNLCSISPDGKDLYLSLQEDQIYDIYVSHYKRGRWSKIEKLNSNINSFYSETHATVTADGKTLYFTSDRPGGIGAMDIWVSQKDAKDEWGMPTNLGKPVNSVYSEETPFINDKGDLLFFSSMGHPTMGGFDVFYSSLLPTGKWSFPANLGYPVSTCDDDLFYYPLGQGRQALYSGFMDQGEERLKVYLVNLDTSVQVENIALRGTVKLQDNIRELDSTFTVSIVKSENRDTLVTVFPNQQTGEYSVDLKPGNYEVTTQGKGYTKTLENVAVIDGVSPNEIRMETGMTPSNVSSGEFLVIRNVLFDFDNFSLNEEAKRELDKLYRAMQLHPQIYVQVTGHSDSKGNEDYNLKLSVKRARSVVEYLVSKGIGTERFVSLGIGEQQSIAMNQNPDGTDNPEGRRLNRYAEIKLINNSDEKIKIAEIEVPQHLKPRAEISYIVLIAQSTDPAFSPAPVEGVKINLIETDHARLFTTEDFRDKSKAVEKLNFLIDNGYPEAKILNQAEKEELILSLSDNREPNEAPFTIQVLALRKPLDIKSVEKMANVTPHTGKDGYFRYTAGKYDTREDAMRDLQDVYLRKFPDAFIVSLNRFAERTASGISDSAIIKFTIQFSATHKAADKSKYKNLGNVRVTHEADGYYRYSTGMFTDRAEAEVELNRIKALGYTDAFLKKIVAK